MQNDGNDLAGKRILDVEDEYMVAELLLQTLEQWGAEVIGPASTLAAGLAIARSDDRLDFAVLDINLQGNTSYPIADVLRQHGVPFLFATGYDSSVIPDRYGEILRCEKPIPGAALIRAIQDVGVQTQPAGP
jgi:CheY-like chemotaxis protein